MLDPQRYFNEGFSYLAGLFLPGCCCCRSLNGSVAFLEGFSMSFSDRRRSPCPLWLTQDTKTWALWFHSNLEQVTTGWNNISVANPVYRFDSSLGENWFGFHSFLGNDESTKRMKYYTTSFQQSGWRIKYRLRRYWAKKWVVIFVTYMTSRLYLEPPCIHEQQCLWDHCS